MYVPTLLAVSPLAATRSAPTRMTSTSPRAIRCPAATSGSSACGTPAWASSQVVSRAPWRYGRVSSTQTWSGATGMVGGLDDAQRGAVLAAGERSRVAVGQDPDRPVVVGRRQDRHAERREAPVVGGRLEDDPVGLLAHRVGDGRAVLGQLVELGVAGEDALDRPAEVDRRRPGVDERIGGAADRRLARVRTAVTLVLGAHREADRRDLADRRRPADDHLADGPGRLAGRFDRVLDELVGELALVDEVEHAAVLAERGPEAARAAEADSRRSDPRRPRPRSERVSPAPRGSGSPRPPRPRSAGAPARHRPSWPPSGPARPRSCGRTCAGRGPRQRSPAPRARARRPAGPAGPGSAPDADGPAASIGASLAVGSVAGSVNRRARCGGRSVLDDAGHAPALESVATLQEFELDQEGEADDLALESLDELDRPVDGAAGGEQVVDDQDLLARPRSRRGGSRACSSRTRGRIRR